MGDVRLTHREQEVLNCLACGLTTTQTAKELFLSYETIKTYRKRLMSKLGARNAFQLGAITIKYDLV